MTIATKAFSAIGPKVFTPQGPIGSSGFAFPQFDYGEVVMGDKEAEYVQIELIVEAACTLNQGDFLVWDASFAAGQALAGVSSHIPGSGVGTLFLGGRIGDTASAPAAGNVWSFTFAPGVYSVWAQRFGVSAGSWGTITAQGDTAFTTATASRLGALASAGTNGATIPNVFSMPTSITFTATTTLGSNILTACASAAGLLVKGVRKGQAVSTTNLPAGCVIQSVDGNTITLRNTLNTAGPNATATGTSQTITVNLTSMWATFSNVAGSANVMKVDGVYGMIPNMTLSGTGVGSSSLLQSIVGNPGNLTANVSVANTAVEATPVLVTGTGYVETMLRLPYVSVQS